MRAVRWARATRGCAALALVCGVALLGPVPPPAWAGPEPGAEGCDNARPDGAVPGSPDVPWAQRRLAFDRVQRLATGAGVTVAVLDSGVDPRALPDTDLAPGINVMGGGYQVDDVRDCDPDGHGTGVTALLAARPSSEVGFVGLAPAVRVLPVKVQDPDTDELFTSQAVARAIDAVLDGPEPVDVINLSLDNTDTPELRAAVERAGREDVVVVAAAGNTGDQTNAPAYPAAYADDGPEFEHVIAVGAVDGSDAHVGSSTTGPFVGVSAPGEEVVAPTSIADAYRSYSGTSFAAPFVSATAALLRERYPRMSAAEVVTRIKATADRPGVTVPDDGYGYGILNPYVALTAVRDDSRIDAPSERLPAVAPPDLPPPPDRTLQHAAYAVGAGLLGGALLLAVGSAAWRRTLAARRGSAGSAGASAASGR